MRKISQVIKNVVITNRKNSDGMLFDITFEGSNGTLTLPELVLRKKFNLNGTPIMDFPSILKGKTWEETVNLAQDIVAKSFSEMSQHVSFLASLGMLSNELTMATLSLMKDFASKLIRELDGLEIIEKPQKDE